MSCKKLIVTWYDDNLRKKKTKFDITVEGNLTAWVNRIGGKNTHFPNGDILKGTVELSNFFYRMAYTFKVIRIWL